MTMFGNEFQNKNHIGVFVSTSSMHPARAHLGTRCQRGRARRLKLFTHFATVKK